MGEQETKETCILPNMPALPRDAQQLSGDIRHYLEYHLGRFLGCDLFYLYESLAYTVRDRIMSDWRNTWCMSARSSARRAHYLSLEFLIGRLLQDAVSNLGLDQTARDAMAMMGVDYSAVVGDEPDAALGNGGRGVGNQLEAWLINPLARGLFDENVDAGESVTVHSCVPVNGVPTLTLKRGGDS